jgi:hypothetical protein
VGSRPAENDGAKSMAARNSGGVTAAENQQFLDISVKRDWIQRWKETDQEAERSEYGVE